MFPKAFPSLAYTNILYWNIYFIKFMVLSNVSYKQSFTVIKVLTALQMVLL